MKKCTIGKRHKWNFVKNFTMRSETATLVSFSEKGLYKCECGEKKYGESRKV